VSYAPGIKSLAASNDRQEEAFTNDERSVGLARASEEERMQHDREWVQRLGERWRNHHNWSRRTFAIIVLTVFACCHVIAS
jgi:hypothetical protein